MCGTCCCFFFFFQSHGAHRHLHSFPTRRSSDLVLLRSLAERGMRHEDVDVVVLSHLHFDHAGGLLSAFEEGQPPQLLFPKARFVVSRTAWERALAPHPRDRASFIAALPELLRASGRLEIVDGP